VVGEPFHVNCSLRDFHPNINSSMLRFCVQRPNDVAVAVDDYVHFLDRASAQLVYTLHKPSQNSESTHIKCFLKNLVNVNCSNTTPGQSSKISTVIVGCK